MKVILKGIFLTMNPRFLVLPQGVHLRHFPFVWVVVMCIAVVMCSCNRQATPPSPKEVVLASPSAPRILRYISHQQQFKGMACLGQVVQEKDGIPFSVINLGHMNQAFCTEPDIELHVNLFQQAFRLADKVVSGDVELNPAQSSEDLNTKELDNQILAPIPINNRQLERQQRFIIGAGLNYLDHRQEVDAKEKLLLFPKFVEPSGAYSSVETGLKLGMDIPMDVNLLDFEVELGVVLLEDIDLASVPNPEVFKEQIAFFLSNDISNRGPIILDQKSGYTKGKSHATYLPTGPWMIHGRHLQPKTARGGTHNLELGLLVGDITGVSSSAEPGFRLAQKDTTSSMRLGPREILNELAERFRSGERIAMQDASGALRYLHTDRGIIPAGSIILTGTPGGTAIKSPDLWQKTRLFMSGGFSKQGAKKEFLISSEQESDRLGYLQVGDRVECWITGLGRQRWQVISSSGKAQKNEM